MSITELAIHLKADSNQTVRAIAHEIYRANPIGVPAEAELTEALGDKYPPGTFIRINGTNGPEIKLPGLTPTNDWRRF